MSVQFNLQLMLSQKYTLHTLCTVITVHCVDCNMICMCAAKL